MVTKTSCTLSLSVAALIISLLSTAVQQCMKPSHWMWPAVYYHVHQAVIEQGHLTIIDNSQNDSQVYSFGNVAQEPCATITITDARYFKEAVTGIDVGLGESVCDVLLLLIYIEYSLSSSLM